MFQAIDFICTKKFFLNPVFRIIGIHFYIVSQYLFILMCLQQCFFFPEGKIKFDLTWCGFRHLNFNTTVKIVFCPRSIVIFSLATCAYVYIHTLTDIFIKWTCLWFCRALPGELTLWQLLHEYNLLTETKTLPNNSSFKFQICFISRWTLTGAMLIVF